MIGDDVDLPLENVSLCNTGFTGTSRDEDTEDTDPER